MALSRDLYTMQWATDLSALANQARFGLKYFLKGQNKDIVSELIKDGLRLCEILGEGAKAGQVKEILPKQTGYLNAIKPLMESEGDLEEVTKGINRVSSILKLILKNERPSEEDISSADSFFVGISKVYQKAAFSTLNALVEEKVFF